MSTSANNQAANQQAFHDLMEGQQEDDFTEDEGVEEAVHVRRARARENQTDDEDIPALIPEGRPPPPPPPPGRPGNYQPSLAPIRSTGTMLGRNPASPPMSSRMGLNPTFSPRGAYMGTPSRVDGKAYKSPLQPQHFDSLKTADEWPVWERRFRSHLRSIPGYGEQLDVGYESLIDSVKQEEILNFLIQKVQDPNGFDKLLTVEGETVAPGAVSSRGRRAWLLLKEHYEQVQSVCPHLLMAPPEGAL